MSWKAAGSRVSAKQLGAQRSEGWREGLRGGWDQGGEQRGQDPKGPLQPAGSFPSPCYRCEHGSGLSIPNSPSIPGIPAAPLSLLQPEGLDTIVCPQGMVAAQAGGSTKDRLLLSLAGMSLSILYTLFMLANGVSLSSSPWQDNLTSTCLFCAPSQFLVHRVTLPLVGHHPARWVHHALVNCVIQALSPCMSFGSSRWQSEFKLQRAFPSLHVPHHPTDLCLLPELHLPRMLQDQPGRVQDRNAQPEGIHKHLNNRRGMKHGEVCNTHQPRWD